MKVLVLTTTYPRWDDDTEPAFVHELNRRLVEHGHEVDVLTPHHPGATTHARMDGVTVLRFRYFFSRYEILAGDGGIVARLRRQKVTVLLLPFFAASFFLHYCRALINSSYDVIHTHWLIPQGLLAATAACLPGHRPPFIATSHGGDLFALRGRMFRGLRRWVSRHAARITVVSRYMQQVLTGEGVDADKIDVIPMGVDLHNRFHPLPGVERDVTRIIFVGRLVEKKGVRYLLEAFSRLRPHHPTAQLAIVGDGPLREELVNLSDKLDISAHVEFLGARPQAELPALYSRAAVAVVPSVVDALGDQEGLGLVTIEALGCGCAVVASDLPAIRDVIRHSRNCIFALPGDPDDLGAKISDLLVAAPDRKPNDIEVELIAKFSWETVADRYAKLLNEVAHNSSARLN